MEPKILGRMRLYFPPKVTTATLAIAGAAFLSSRAFAQSIETQNPKGAASQLPISVGEVPPDSQEEWVHSQQNESSSQPRIEVTPPLPINADDTPLVESNNNLQQTGPRVPTQLATSVGDRDEFEAPAFQSEGYVSGASGTAEMMSRSLLGTGLSKKWGIYTSLQTSLTYDDNVFLSDHDKQSALVATLGGGIALAVGQADSTFSGVLSYAAGVQLLDQSSNQNAFDNDIGLMATWRFPKLTLGVNSSFQSLTGGSVDVGDRVRRTPFYIGITTHYPISDKLSLDVNGDYTLARFSGLLDSQEFRVQSFVNYQVTPKIQLGLGGSFGDLDVEQSPSQTYEQALLRVTYAATDKLGFNLSGGEEWRQFGGKDTGDANSIFGLGVSYALREKTTFTLDAHRRIYGSAALAGQDYIASGFVLGVGQQISYRLRANLSAGYEHTDYIASESGADASRKDNYFFARIGADWTVASWLGTGIYYEISDNESSGFGARSFNRNRVGIYASFRF
jgi:hypothetical protein